MARRDRGRSTVPMLVAAALVTIVVVVAFPKVTTAWNRSRQRRTDRDMRALATALGSYWQEHRVFPADDRGIDGAVAALGPAASALPARDAWGNPYLYVAPRAPGEPMPTSYTLISCGRNGVYEGFKRDLTRYFDCDIIYNDGQALQHFEPVCCIVAGTLVETPAGPCAIESLTIGDRVWGRAPDGTMAAGSVTSTRRRPSPRSYRLVMADGRRLELTGDHRVWADGRFTYTQQLAPGARMTSLEGPLTLASVERIEATVDTFDLTVAGNASFFAAGMLVHNKK